VSALTAESKDIQWPAGATDKVRLTPTVAALLDSARRADQTKSDQLQASAVQVALIEPILRLDLWTVYRRVGVLLGVDGSAGKAGASEAGDFPSGKPLPVREGPPRKPLASASAKSLPKHHQGAR